MGVAGSVSFVRDSVRGLKTEYSSGEPQVDDQSTGQGQSRRSQVVGLDLGAGKTT